MSSINNIKLAWLVLSFLCAGTFLVSAPSANAQTENFSAMEDLMGQPVTMSALGTPQTVSDAAATMTIITADEIRQSGSRSIPQILSRVPGLDILQESTTGFDVGVRGYQQAMQPSLLVLIDGRQVFSDDYSRTIWENLPVNIDDIRQIEVVKGASSALFGSNAARGVVNIITYNPFFDKNNVGSVSYGTQNTVSADATGTAKIGDFGGAKISAGGLNGHEFNTDRSASEQAVTKNPGHQYLTQSDMFQLSPKIQTYSEVTYSRSTGTESLYNGFLSGVTDTSYSVRGEATWQTLLGTLKSNNFLNHSEIETKQVSTSLPVFSDTTTAFTSQLEDEFKLGRDHILRASVEYNHKDFDLLSPQSLPTMTAVAANSKIEENNYAIGGMWLWQINDHLALSNALRLDHLMIDESGSLVDGGPFGSADYTHTLNQVSENSGLVYKPTTQDTLRATYGRGIEMPSLLDYGFNNINSTNGSTTQALEHTGNPLLKPTVSTNYELGYDRALPAVYSTARVSVYYQQNQDIISPFSTVDNGITVGNYTNTRLLESTNVGNSHALGGELQFLGKEPNGFRWDASYSYTQVRDQSGVSNPPGNGILNAFGYDNSTPYHHLRALLGYTLGAWEFDTNSQYLTSRLLLRSASTRLPSSDYFLVSARVGYTIMNDTTVALSALSLNQDPLSQTAYPAIERQAMISLTKKF